MAFAQNNPVFSSGIFTVGPRDRTDCMTVFGVTVKTAVLTLLVIMAAAWTWDHTMNPNVGVEIIRQKGCGTVR